MEEAVGGTGLEPTPRSLSIPGHCLLRDLSFLSCRVEDQNAGLACSELQHWAPGQLAGIPVCSSVETSRDCAGVGQLLGRQHFPWDTIAAFAGIISQLMLLHSDMDGQATGERMGLVKLSAPPSCQLCQTADSTLHPATVGGTVLPKAGGVEGLQLSDRESWHRSPCPGLT